MTFLECIGMAEMEKVHSQIISYVFSPHCDCISLSDKEMLLTNLFGLNNFKLTSIQSYTEYASIDILIATDTHLFVIENKLKSNQYPEQLNTYQSRIINDSRFNGLKREFGFLTFISEPAIAKHNWKNISYQDLHTLLKSINISACYDTPFINDYHSYLNDLYSVLNAFDSNHTSIPNVFTDASLKKCDKRIKSNNLTYIGNMIFVSRNNLESVLQWRFFKKSLEDYFTNHNIQVQVSLPEKNKLRWSILGTKIEVFLTRPSNGGDIVLDVRWGDKFKFGNDEFIFCLQFQGQNLKFGFHASDYNHVPFSAIPEQVRQYLKNTLRGNFGHDKFNDAKSKTFMSVSRTYTIYNKNYNQIESDFITCYNNWIGYYNAIILPIYNQYKV
jgi:hypothetical protein